jgi:tetratricopeptide (TPR) repeat protein
MGRRVAGESERNGQSAMRVADPPAEPEKPKPSNPYAGKFGEVMKVLDSGATERALIAALSWRADDPGDVMALIALGEALEAGGNKALAARAYGSIIDLYPSRADMRRFAGGRLARLGADAATLAVDTFAKAVEQRADHPSSHRLYAYALLRAGELEKAFAAMDAALSREYPGGRFAGVDRILRDDLGLIGAAYLRAEPAQKPAILKVLKKHGVEIATKPSTRFVMSWETDANDVDLHIFDAMGNHASYSNKQLASGGELYADVTTGYGPEAIVIPGKASAGPYHLQAHYYSRGPMGYGMGTLDVITHDGNGVLGFEHHPFVIMNDDAYVDLLR